MGYSYSFGSGVAFFFGFYGLGDFFLEFLRESSEFNYFLERVDCFGLDLEGDWLEMRVSWLLFWYLVTAITKQTRAAMSTAILIIEINIRGNKDIAKGSIKFILYSNSNQILFP